SIPGRPANRKHRISFVAGAFVVQSLLSVDRERPPPTMRPALPMQSLDSDKLRLTDFMDLPTLQEIQDSFAAVANVKAIITDADGALLTQPTPTTEFLRRQSALAADEENQAIPDPGAAGVEGPQKEGAEYV